MNEMDWTDLKITVPAAHAQAAQDIATGISGGGIYIEDYRDLEQQVEAIAHVDLIEQDLLDKRRDEVAVHLYVAPDENAAEIADLLRDRLARAEVPYRLDSAGVREEDWQNSWKQYYHAMDIGRRLAIVPAGSNTTPIAPSSRWTRAWPSAPAPMRRPPCAWKCWTR